MYEKHFKFSRKPFEQLPDPAFLYLTPQHEEALTRMRFALAINDSFAVITGEVGSGKTTLVRKMLLDTPADSTVAFITHTRLSDVELLQFILVEFGMRPYDMGKVEMLVELRQFIEKRHAEGGHVIIVVDEAQNLGIDVLEELRLLTCLDSNEEKAMNIVLIGQPQLSRLLDSPDLEQLRQRCRLRFHLHRLSKEQTLEYIEHRVMIARNGAADVFDTESKSAIFEHTGGVPRLINTLCDTALVMACVSSKKTVTRLSVDEALAELGWTVPTATHVAGKPPTTSSDEADAVLTLRKDAKLMAEFPLIETSYVIGRAPDCGIQIDSEFLSRHHAIVSRNGMDWTISDLRSTNGVRVNGRPAHIQALSDGDIIALGVHHLIFRQADRLGPRLATSSRDLPSADLGETYVIHDDERSKGGGD